MPNCCLFRIMLSSTAQAVNHVDGKTSLNTFTFNTSSVSARDKVLILNPKFDTSAHSLIVHNKRRNFRTRWVGSLPPELRQLRVWLSLQLSRDLDKDDIVRINNWYCCDKDRRCYWKCWYANKEILSCFIFNMFYIACNKIVKMK